jgi:hypothetical protein
MGKISPNFSLEEFVPKELFQQFGDKSIWFIDKRIIDIAEAIRNRFGKAVTINNWHVGGQLNNRGFRMPDTSVGGKLSQHKFGRAIDVNVAGVTVKEVYDDIVNNYSGIYQKLGVTTLEDIAFTPTWTHIDCRNTGLNNILIVKP